MSYIQNSHMPQFSPLRLAAYCRFILTPITRCHRLSPRTARNAENRCNQCLPVFGCPHNLSFIVPILADKTGGYTDIRTYKWVVMPFAVVGLGLGMFAAFGTKERIVVPKTYIPKVNTIRSSLGVFKNKYWVITTISATIGFWRAVFQTF